MSHHSSHSPTQLSTMNLQSLQARNLPQHLCATKQVQALKMLLGAHVISDMLYDNLGFWGLKTSIFWPK